MSIQNEYFKYYENYKIEYGEKVCVLMQVGMFYEIYGIKNQEEQIGNVDKIGEILNIQVTKRNKNNTATDRSNPYMAGFQITSLSKFLPLLTDNGYTVVVIDQDGTKNKNGNENRKIKGIYSSSILPAIFECNQKQNENKLISVMIEFNTSKFGKNICYNIGCMNIYTNVFEIYEFSVTDCNNYNYNNLLDNIQRVLSKYTSCYSKDNYVFHIITNSECPNEFSKTYLTEYLNIDNLQINYINSGVSTRATITSTIKEYNEFLKIDYQNEFLKKVYSHVDFGLLKPIEYFDLSMYQLMSLHVVYILKFISKHDLKYLENISPPVIVNENEHLVLELNTLKQLHILPQNIKQTSLFDVINKTITTIGKRHLQERLTKPFKSTKTINSYLELTQSLKSFDNVDTIRNSLSGICDIQRLMRRISMCVFNPHEFTKLYMSLINIKKIINTLNSDSEPGSGSGSITFNFDRLGYLNIGVNQNSLDKCIDEIITNFDLDKMSKYSLNDTYYDSDNFFNSGIHNDIDKIVAVVNNIQVQVEKERCKYSNCFECDDYLKTSFTDNDGYYFTCTKVRSELLKQKLTSLEYNKLRIKMASTNVKITSEQLDNLSNKYVVNKELLWKIVKSKYTNYLSEFYIKYNKMFNQLVHLVGILDVSQSDLRCKELYKYCYPVISEGSADSQESQICVKKLRHPIIERILVDTEFVANDITLGGGSADGMILYALNSCGKSSLLRSVGVCVLLAQCGLSVPAESCDIVPFHTIISQVDMIDNMWKAQSSFVNEMIGLRKILSVSDCNTLVLVDELTKGTEAYSATSIFAASILELMKLRSKFIFTTHLQEILSLDEIKNVYEMGELNVSHLSVRVDKDDNIIFERRLQPGPCSSLYGLEVAKAIGLPKNVIDHSFNLRKTLIGNRNEIVSTKRSKYNRKKLVDHCEICNYVPVNKTDIPLDIHHIQFQCSADEQQFTGHFHKNSKHNLVCLCKSCHIKVHEGKIHISGYVSTTTGVKLDYSLNR